MMDLILADSFSDAQEALWDHLEREGRMRMECTLNALLKAERDVFLGCEHYEHHSERRGWRNGFDPRRVDTRWGPMQLRMPKVRDTATPFRSALLSLYQRRQEHLNRCVLRWVASGFSTRAVSREFTKVFGGVLSAGTVSRIVATVDAEMMRFRTRPLPQSYRYVYLDGKYGKVAYSRKGRGRGRARKSVLLLAWGICHDGREELIDFEVAPDESERSWLRFLDRLRIRGVVETNPWGQRLEGILCDGHNGIEAALAMAYPETPHHICVFHKIQNLTRHLSERGNRAAIAGEAGAIFNATTRAEAVARLHRWRKRWQDCEPEAVANFLRDQDRMLLVYEAPPELRSRLKTTNPIERFIGELSKKFNRIGVFPNIDAWHRATFLVYRLLLQANYKPLTTKYNSTRDT